MKDVRLTLSYTELSTIREGLKLIPSTPDNSQWLEALRRKISHAAEDAMLGMPKASKA